MNLWALVLLTIVGCYALKLVGYLLPTRVLEHRRTRRVVELLPSWWCRQSPSANTWTSTLPG